MVLAARRHVALATVALAAVTAIWGSTFFLIKNIVDRVAVADMLALRFGLAAMVMLPLAARSLVRLSARQWRRALALGVVYGLAQLLQTWGLARTAASINGFVTGMYVVLTPLLSTLLLRQRLPGATWAAVLLATLGLAILTLKGFAIGAGVWLTLAAAVLYALHIVGLGCWARADEALALATVQMLAIALVCMLGTLPRGPMLPPDRDACLVILYLALCAGAGTLLVQTWAQAQLPATRAAIVMVLEPVFAAGFAVAFGGENISWRMFLGGALVLTAMYLTELAPRRVMEAVRDEA